MPLNAILPFTRIADAAAFGYRYHSISLNMLELFMELYGSYTSPFVRHCRIALHETGQDYRFVETDAIMSAKLSPTQKVPFLKDGERLLTDSSSILKYIRETAGHTFISDIDDYELYCTVNTLLDSAINGFLFYKFDRITEHASTYLQRQKRRLITGLTSLNQQQYHQDMAFSDGELRLACFLDYALFRDLITLDGLDNLQTLLDAAAVYEPFQQTSPTEQPLS